MENELKNKDLEQVSGGASWEELIPEPKFEPVQVFKQCSIIDCQINKEECDLYQSYPLGCYKK